MTQINKFSRKMTILERMHFRQPNANVVMVAIINKELQPELLTEAIQKLVEIHPLIGSRILLTEDQEKAFFVKNETNKISISVRKREHPQTWKSIVDDELRKPFSCKEGPLIRFTILNSPFKSELIICCHHMICDGLSLVYLLRDLFLLITNQIENLKMLFPPLILDSNLPIKQKQSFLSKLVYKIINKKWEKNNIRIFEDDYIKVHQEFWKNHKSDFISWIIPSILTSKIIKKSKEHGVSVNSTIVTALLAAQTKIQESANFKQNIIISVDFRQELISSAGESFGKFASAIRPSLNYDFSTDFWDVAKKINTTIKEDLTNKNIFASQNLGNLHPVLIDSIFFVKYGLLEDDIVTKIIERANMDKITAGSIVTNLGKLKIPSNYGEYHLESIFGPFVFSDTMEKYFGILTINDQIHVSISFGEPYIDRKTIETIKDAFLDYLTQALGKK